MLVYLRPIAPRFPHTLDNGGQIVVSEGQGLIFSSPPIPIGGRGQGEGGFGHSK